MGIYDDPADRWPAVTPNDSTDLPARTRSIRVGTTAGNIAAVNRDGVTEIIPNVQIGEILPIRTTRILATGTTADGITAFY